MHPDKYKNILFTTFLITLLNVIMISPLLVIPNTPSCVSTILIFQFFSHKMRRMKSQMHLNTPRF